MTLRRLMYQNVDRGTRLEQENRAVRPADAVIHQFVERQHVVRRQLLIGACAAAVLRAVSVLPTAARDDAVIPELATVPTTGARRPGPMIATASAGQSPSSRGDVPVAIRIPNAAVDAAVERIDIIDGVMQNPSGPWVVSWYHDLGTLGRRDNVVMAGHVDYWDIGPAIFWNLSQLVAGDAIDVVSEQARGFTYAVEWMKNYVVAEMTAEDLDEMLGNAGEALTLITCAIGSWDPDAQEYRERTVLRATQL